MIDTHCHLHDTAAYDYVLSQNPKLNPEDFTPRKLLDAAKENDVNQIICIGTSHEDSLAACLFAATHENTFWSYGIHPEEASAKALDSFSLEETISTKTTQMGLLENVPRSGSCPNESERPVKTGSRAGSREDPSSSLIAIGEVGLDYHQPHDQTAQISLLERMLHLAQEKNLPVIFHVRDAFDDFFAVLNNFPKIKRAVVHSFSDTKENLEKCLERDFYIGVNGLATFADIPLPILNRTLLETDAPFLSPKPLRGRPNHPANLKYIAEFLAKKHQTELKTVKEITANNAKTLFNLP